MNLKVDLAQQLAWLASVLSTSPSPLVAYAKPSIRYISASSSFLISVQHSPLYTSSETSCWLPLFTGAVIACGFPIAARGTEVGLDIPLEILAAIVGVRHAVEFGGGVCLKGFSHMLVPVCKNEDRIQWHAVSNSDENSRLTYADGISQCKNRALLNEVSLEDAFKSRAIVGWCSVVNSQLGSTTANYENIDYSGAVDAESNVKCTGGAFGFQQFGTAVLDFKLGVRDGKCHFQRNGPYRRIVSAAEKTHVVLHDTGQKRAWLVPASAVALHILQHRHQLEPFEKNRKPVELNTDVPFGSSAKKILLTLEDISLSDADDYKVRDAVLNIWSLLEFLIDQNVARDILSPGTTIKTTLREFIAGFEFKAVVEERSPFRQKHSSLNKTNGGWPQLIRDIDALVLMADGFEDILLPANSVNPGICTSWRRVPTGLDYMTTSTRTLKDLYDVAGCRLDRKFLTSTKLRWHQGNSLLFEACPEADTKPCQCNRLQRILPKSAMGTVSTPTHMNDDGAVIFGYRGSMINNLNSTPRATEPKMSGLYSQRNISLSAMATEPISQLSPHSDTSSLSEDEVSPDIVSMYTTFSSQDKTPEFIDPPVISSVPQLSKHRQRDDIQKTPSSEEEYDSFLEDAQSVKRMRTATASSGTSNSSSATFAQALASALAQRLPGCDGNSRLTRDQFDVLEQHFLQQNKSSTNVKKEFASKFNVPLDKINNWFQNRKAKVKQDRKLFLDKESYLGT
ncbi:hypothetical protein IQ07DRAFT_125417 [Pyrenochaeta sp. DS3sAY3a]|nr:hypothetical protein IQ07DRAFT_125417 [Pyrenochaeta sp. DS3sAY3a]